jgi:hypothetical protein
MPPNISSSTASSPHRSNDASGNAVLCGELPVSQPREVMSGNLDFAYIAAELGRHELSLH